MLPKFAKGTILPLTPEYQLQSIGATPIKAEVIKETERDQRHVKFLVKIHHSETVRQPGTVEITHTQVSLRTADGYVRVFIEEEGDDLNQDFCPDCEQEAHSREVYVESRGASVRVWG